MTGHNRQGRLGCNGASRSALSVFAIMVFATASLPVFANDGDAGKNSDNPLLSATLVGRLEAGAQGRLAVRWDGPAGSLLDVWVDVDGDGAPASHELVAEGHPLIPGIEVVNFELPPGIPVVPDPRVWVRARARGWCEGAAAMAAVAGDNGNGCAWQPGFEYWALQGSVAAMTVWDDGSGPALFVAGSLADIGTLVVNNIARWDGSGWSALRGPSGTGVDGTVRALAVFDDGTAPALYVGGQFTTAGGVEVNSIARWDGTAWSALGGPSGSGVEGSVWALSPFDDGSGLALYIGGQFTFAGGVRVNNIARWDGGAWSALGGPAGTGVNSIVRALAVFDNGTGPALAAGGGFATAGGVTVNHIARWDGSAWSALSGPSGTGVDRYVYAIAVFDDGSGPALYAGGLFSLAGGVTVNHIARWDGSAWSALSQPAGTGVSGWVYAITASVDGPTPGLFVAGAFESAGGVTAFRVARWDGASWSALGGPAGTGVDGPVNALAVFDDGAGPALFAGGDFESAGGIAAFRVARWDGSAWSDADTHVFRGMSGPVRAFAVFDDGSGPALYAGGSFSTAGGVAVNNIARWDGSGWTALSGPSGTGVEGSVEALAVFDDGFGPALFAGGWFWTAGGVTVNGIARWDGNEWSALAAPSGTGVSGGVSALAVFDDGSGPALYVGGSFGTAGGVTVNSIARWDGSAWAPLSGHAGTGVDGSVEALAVFDDGFGLALYAGGWFSTAGGVTVNGIARWDGSEWSALAAPAGTGVQGWVEALEVFDDGSGLALYAGGWFVTAGDIVANSIARWNGSHWSALSGPSSTGVQGSVEALEVFDDGSGSALYVGGWFDIAGGVTVEFIARWNGSHWCALDTGVVGMNGEVSALAAFDDGSGATLYAGGDFTTAGGQPSGKIAAWRCSYMFADGFESGDTAAWSATVP